MAHRDTTIGIPAHFLALAVFLLLLAQCYPAFCDVQELNEAESEIDEQETATVVAEPLRAISVQSGYRVVSPDKPAAASPYARLKSGVTGGLSVASLTSDMKLLVEGMFLHEDDYTSDLVFDYGGLVRMHAGSGALWHNILREQIDPGTLTLRETDRTTTYGVRTATTHIDSRIKLGNNPFHLNLGYWRLSKEGYEQLRYSDHSFGAGTSYISSQASLVDRVTQEGNVGLDAHLGLFDISYGFRIRDFSNQSPDNRDLVSNTANGALLSGVQAHDVIPDSRVTSHSIKLYTNLNGGLVGTAAYTLIQRENGGGHGDAVPSSRPTDSIHSAAGDISYTPFKELSFAVKYRHQETDRNTPASIYYPFSQIPVNPPGVYTATPGTLLVRPAIDTVKDMLVLSSIFRPGPKIIYRLEYRAELESRGNVLDPLSPVGSPGPVHSDRHQSHTGKASFFWKPFNGLRFNSSYSYTASDNTSDGASFSDRHAGQLLMTYVNTGKWGVTGSYLVQYETNETSATTVASASTVEIAPSGVVSLKLPRKSTNDSANVSFWFCPAERLTITTSYSFLQSDIDQTMLITTLSSGSLAATNYRSASHVYGVDAVYNVSDQLDLSLAVQQVRSAARFNVPPASFSQRTLTTGEITDYTTDGITALTNLDATETGISTRADWRFTSMLGCVLDYSFRKYDSGNPVYDGSVHTTMFSLKARW